MITKEKPLIIRSISIIDGIHNKISYYQNILIENGIISDIWQGNVANNQGIKIIEGYNKFAIPALIDSHVHLFPGCHNIFLTHGIAGVRDMASVADWTIEQRRGIEAGEYLGPRIYTHGELIDGITSRRKNDSFTICVNSEEEIALVVRQLAQKGVDAIKLYSELPISIFLEGIRCAHAYGLQVSVHVGHSRRVTVRQAIEAGANSVEHTATFLPDLFSSGELVDIINNAKIQKNQLRGYFAWSRVNIQNPIVNNLISLCVERQVFHTPTLINIENMIEGNRSIGEVEGWLVNKIPEEITMRWQAQTHCMSENWTAEESDIARDGFQKIKQLVGMMYLAGVRLRVGSDTPNPWTIPGLSLIREMELMVECGISPMKVIQMATENAAVALGKRFDNTGAIIKGNSADIIILNRNPLTNISYCLEKSHFIRHGELVDVETMEVMG